MKLAGVVLTVVLTLGACSSGADAPRSTGTTEPAQTATPLPTPCSVAGASTGTHERELAAETAPVTDVRYDAEDCPRIVFQFVDHTPGYKVAYVTPPFSDCGSGEEVKTETWGATAFIEIRLSPSGGVDLSKSAEPTYTGPRDISVNGKVLKHLKVTCDFEAVFTWLVGLNGKHAFDVQTLNDPARLVVDVSET